MEGAFAAFNPYIFAFLPLKCLADIKIANNLHCKSGDFFANFPNLMSKTIVQNLYRFKALFTTGRFCPLLVFQLVSLQIDILASFVASIFFLLLTYECLRHELD